MGHLVRGAISHVFVRPSPYRPFGAFVFVTKSGAICIDDTVAVLQMLYVTLKGHDVSPDTAAEACLREHVSYDELLISSAMTTLGTAGMLAGIAIADATSHVDLASLLQLQAIDVRLQVSSALGSVLSCHAVGQRLLQGTSSGMP
eukprot:jgi/Chrzof1/1042/Cz01g38070.t1